MQEIRHLKQEIALRTLHPDIVYDYRSEHDRTEYIEQLKMKLTEQGVDADAFQRRIIIENMGGAAANNVVEIDFKNQAS